MKTDFRHKMFYIIYQHTAQNNNHIYIILNVIFELSKTNYSQECET